MSFAQPEVTLCSVTQVYFSLFFHFYFYTLLIHFLLKLFSSIQLVTSFTFDFQWIHRN
uniref:Uncharacterized protein n=1 Tax=Tetranychus urticae TaxID=32264 RepID=T1JYV0_TETUR